MEVGMAWWWSSNRLSKLLSIEGLEHLEAVPKGRGYHVARHTLHHPRNWRVLRLPMSTQMDGMYRAHGNPVYD